MIKAVIFDLARVLLFPKDEKYQGTLNSLYKDASAREGFVFFDHFVLNEDLLRYIELNLLGRYRLYIFTSGTIQNAPQLKLRISSIFQRVFSAEFIGLEKDDKKAYDFVIKEINITYPEALFIDDDQRNLDAASSTGLQTIRYIDNHQIINHLTALGL